MTETDMQVAMPGGLCDAVLFTPDPSTPLPGVLHLPDIAGILEAHRVMARRLAAEGYAVLMANPFYRTAGPPVFDFPRVSGDPRTMERMKELTARLTPAARAADADAYVDRLLEQPAVRPGMVGLVGYCFTGAMALRGPATRPDAVAAAASFHGGNLFKKDDPDSPYHLLPQVKARLYFGHASNDRSMTAEQIAGLEEALAEWGGRYESETYAAAHGWTVPDSAAFDAMEADRAFAKLKQLFAKTL
jgi:carboxymethylenebutenolidase